MGIGTAIFTMDGSAYFSPQFPRGGLAATFAVKPTQVTSSPTLDPPLRGVLTDARA